jgi:DNA invertase Pin-like site-specific DNA recombinase
MAGRAKAYSYVRFSSAPQEKGDSLRRQTEYSRRYAEKHDLDLDDTLNLRDLGLSAFDGSNIEKGALGAFLHAVKDGSIPKGSYLLVESLDRMSRAQVMQALAVFTQIINAGIIIVTLADEMVYSADKLANDPMPLIMSIMVMIRAHEESATKSKRMRQAWEGKRKRLHTEKLTRTCPSWMELNEDRKAFRLIPERVKVVKRIIKMQMEGVGQSMIVRMLNQEKVPPIQRRVPTESWHPSTIQKIVTSPALYGAYQPTVGIGKKRRGPAGDAVENYYPSVITKDEFILLSNARRERLTRGRGIKGAAFANIFSGLLKCGYCDGSMTVGGHATKDGQRKRYLVCSKAKRGLGCYFVMWTYHLFERTVLAYCDDLDFSSLLDDGRGAKSHARVQRDVVEVLKGKREEAHKRLSRLLNAIEEGNAPTSLLERIRSTEEKLAEIDAQLKAEEQKLADMQLLQQDASLVKASIIDLVEHFERKQGDELLLLRAKVAAQLKRVVKRIDVYPGGYLMSNDEWSDFTSGMSKRGIEQEGLETLKTPDKKTRFAVIVGINGRSFPTYNPWDARLKGKMKKAELMNHLGITH